MDIPSLPDRLVCFAGLVGTALFMYSAGYTRGLLAERGVPLVSTSRLIFSIDSLPTWTGLMAFAGMALVAFFIVGQLFSVRTGS